MFKKKKSSAAESHSLAALIYHSTLSVLMTREYRLCIYTSCVPSLALLPSSSPCQLLHVPTVPRWEVSHQRRLIALTCAHLRDLLKLCSSSRPNMSGDIMDPCVSLKLLSPATSAYWQQVAIVISANALL